MRPAFALVILGLLLLPPARADFVVRTFTNDFALSAPTGDVALCACQTFSDALTLENTGNLPASIAVQGTGPDWLRLAQTQATLQPGEGAALPYALAAPCGQTLTDTLTFLAVSDQGRRKSVTRTVRVAPCQTIAAALAGPEVLAPCDLGRFALTVTNTGPFPDTFEVSSPSPEVAWSDTALALAPGASATTVGYLSVPCDRTGSIEVPVTVRARANGQSASYTHRLTIPADLAYRLEIPQLRICAGATTEVPLTVRNEGGIPNTYRLRLDGPAFASLSPSSADVPAFGQGALALTLAPAAADEGRHTLRLTAQAERGRREERLTQPVDVMRCYEAGLQIQQAGERRCCGPQQFAVTIENRGLYEDTFDVHVEGPVWATPEGVPVTLAPSEQKDLTFTVDAPCSDGRLDLEAVATSSAGRITRAPLAIQTAQPATCYRLDVEAATLRLSGKAAAVTLPVRYAGLESATFRVLLESDLVALETRDLALAPGQTASLVLRPLNLTGVQPGRYRAVLRFVGDRAAFEHQFFLDVAGPSPLAAVGAFLAAEPLCASFFGLFVVLLLLVLYYLNEAAVRHWLAGSRVVVFKRRPRRPGFRRRWLLAVFLIYAAGVALLVGSAAPRPAPPAPSSGLDYSTAQSTPLVLDLSTLFFDPDGDLLSFSAAAVPDVDIAVVGKTATLTPAKDFVGLRTLTFTASDGRGGTADSPPLRLHVYAVPAQAWAQRFRQWCALIFWTLAALSAAGLGLALHRRGDVTILRK